MDLITATGLGLTFGGHRLLEGIDLTITSGDRLALLGGNGSGKTSLLHLLAGWSLSQRASGQVLWQGRPWASVPVAERARAVQLVGQIPSQHLSGRAFTVIEELAFGPENLCLPLPEIRTRVDRALTLCRLEPLAGRNPFTLSGGEQQRLVLAAALTLDPQVLLLDEPLSNLDPESREAMVAALAALPKDLALVLAETDPSVAAALTRRAVFLEGGRIAAAGDLRDVLLSPGTVARLGRPALTEAWLAATGADPARRDLPLVPADLGLVEGVTC